MSRNAGTASAQGGSTPLTHEQWRQLESLLDVLLDTPPDRRAVLFAEVSGGDPARRAELERLVAECERAHPLFDRPAVERFSALVHTQPLEPSQVVAERYRIARELGRGGMATVYLAHDVKHGRDVALKVVRSELVAALGSGRFLREIEIAARLRHPHIVPLFDSGTISAAELGRTGDGLLYYVMPYEPGQSLRERLRRDGQLPVAETVAILRDVCDALAYAHGQRVVHRDIKPDNVLLSGGHALVSDFGVARAATAISDTAMSTAAGVIVGTPAYMAPEQAAADPRVDHRADIYAVGIMAYEMLAGRVPFDGTSAQDVLTAQLTERPEPLVLHRTGVPSDLTALVMRCLEKQPARRWQSAAEMVSVLDEVRGPVTASHARPGGAPELAGEDATLGSRELARPARRIRRWLAAGAVAVAVASAVVAFQTLGRKEPKSAVASPGDVSARPLAIGFLPVVAATRANRMGELADGLQGQLASELTPVPGLEVRPTETIEAALRLNWPLDSVSLVRGVDYFVRTTLSMADADSVLVTLELIEGGIRSVRVGSVRARLMDESTTVERLARTLAEEVRPMLGSRVRERESESRTTSAVASRLRQRAWQQRLLMRELIVKGDVAGARAAMDSATALLIESERADPNWREPRLERASLAGTRALLVMLRSGTTDESLVRREFDGGIALVDSVLARAPRDAIALAARGRLRWHRTSQAVADSAEAAEGAATARRDLEDADTLDPTLARAAADLSLIAFGDGRYKAAAAYAERAYRLDKFMEESSQIINRLALSSLELERDAVAAAWCAEGVRRFPNNPAHRACRLEVMAWGDGPVNPDSAWNAYRDVRRLTGSQNVAATAIYGYAVAAVLARSHSTPPDSARAVLARIEAEVGASTASESLRNSVLAFQAAVLFRLEDRAAANALVSRLRAQDPGRANKLATRRLLRAYVRPPESSTR